MCTYFDKVFIYSSSLGEYTIIRFTKKGCAGMSSMKSRFSVLAEYNVHFVYCEFLSSGWKNFRRMTESLSFKI